MRDCGVPWLLYGEVIVPGIRLNGRPIRGAAIGCPECQHVSGYRCLVIEV